MEILAAETDAELEQLVEIHNRVIPDDPISLEEVRSFATRPPAIVHLLAADDGRVVGAAVVNTQRERPPALARLWVPEDERGCGIGTALYKAVSDWTRGHDTDTLEAWVEDSDHAGLEFARKRGFEEIGSELRLALDLTAIEAPEVDPPEGILITTWAERPELTAGIYVVACEAYPDIPGQEDELMAPIEEWLANDMQGAGDHPWATFVATAGDEVVGYSKFALAKLTPKVAHHDITGVKRGWRGRGIARALKRAQIAWAKEHGYERLETRNEERNAPIRHLNDEFGYRPWSGRTLVRGPIAAP